MAIANPATSGRQMQWVDAGAQLWVTGYSMKIETFGQLLRRAREDAGLSQEGLGAKVGLSRKTIQTIEAAKGRPKIKNEFAVVTRMAKECGVQVGELSAVGAVVVGVAANSGAPAARAKGALRRRSRRVVLSVVAILLAPPRQRRG